MTFSEAVKRELAAARAKHRPITTVHEGYGVILEELVKCWDEVRARDHNPQRMLAELIQVAAMCQRTAEDLVIPAIELMQMADMCQRTAEDVVIQARKLMKKPAAQPVATAPDSTPKP